ncbi:MbtH family protein [Tomitella fengzijianii]|uniref:MbtH family protein n=1 Tax=Tomitella fengzijianii TaxID=2597660 RepID=A0A516X0G8_9ACTN|nr:MbtH family protein [Tomitella fengzijianii]QDQ96582.1 MbtH family protein [Tomitella fengzijianii]
MSASHGQGPAANPFDDEDSGFLVLVNDEGQHSLWPVFAPVPDGWSVRLGESSRQDAVDFVDRNWTDMRPVSLVHAMDGSPGAPDGERSR